MSARRRNGPSTARKLRSHAPVFAALGDEMRLSLVTKLAGGTPLSVTQLCEGAPVTRQAISKHLRVLEDAGLVHAVRRGRESLYALTPEPLDEARRALDQVAQQWDGALARLKAFVEED